MAEGDVQKGRGLKIHHLRPAPGAHIPRTRVGRGEAGKGKTAGRGTKGTRARGAVAGGFEGGQMPLHRRIPKLKGFSNLRFKTAYQVVNIERLAVLYPDGGDVTPEDLVAKGAVRAGEPVKVLGSGEAVPGLRVTAHGFSATAREKITAAGGTVTELLPPRANTARGPVRAESRLDCGVRVALAVRRDGVAGGAAVSAARSGR